MGFVIILVIVVLAAGAIAIVRANSVDTGWSGFAAKHRLHYQHSGVFGKRRITGKFQGYRVSVQTDRVRRGNYRKTYTRYDVHYGSLGLGLELAREGSFSVLGRFFSKSDLEIGDQQFDREVRLTSNSRERLIEYLTPSRKKVILRALQSHGNCMISDTRIECHERGLVVDSGNLEKKLRGLLELARVLNEEWSAEPEEAGLTRLPMPEGWDEPATQSEEPTTESEQVVYEDLFPVVGEETELHEVVELAEMQIESEIEPVEEVVADPFEVSEPEPPVVLEPAVEPEPMPAEALNTAQKPAKPRVPSLPIEEVTGELFPENQTGNVTADLFEKRYRDRQISGSGRVLRVERYYSDRFFGMEPGARATLIVREMSSSAFGVRAVQAILQLDLEEEELLQEFIGETVYFDGILVHCDPYLHNLIVAEAELR